MTDFQPSHDDIVSQLPRNWLDSLASVAMGAWALRRKYREANEDDATTSLRVHIDAIHDALRQMGVEIEEFTKQPYEPGMNVDILVFQPQPDVHQNTIAATIRPAIHFGNRLIQRSQVIVSTPEQKAHS